MADTTFVDGSTLVTAEWLNDVNDIVYKEQPYLNAFSYFSEAEQVAVKAYSYAVDVTTALQAAMNAAYAAQVKLYTPSGGYLVTGLDVPGTNDNTGKAKTFRMFGEGFGEAGVIGLKNAGTVLYSTTDAPILHYDATAANNGSGTVEIAHLAVYGNSTTPVVNLESFYGTSTIHDCVICQDGIGNGLEINWGATYTIENCYITGASYAATSLGAARTGIGFYAAQNTSSCGLQKMVGCTVAGWHTPIQLGVTGGPAYTYAPQVVRCEIAYCYTGIVLSPFCEHAVVEGCYFEGADGGSYVVDKGNYNHVLNNFFFYSTGSLGSYTMLTSTDPSKFGGRYEGNTFYLFNVASTGIDVASNAVDGGPSKVISRNHFIQSATTANVVGIKLAGVDPRVEMLSNDFQPAGAWTGSNSYKVNDISTSSDTTTGTAVYGMTLAQSKTGALTVPRLGRGAHNIAVDPTVLNNTNVAAGVLTIGELSAFTFTPTSNVSITSIAAPNLPDKTFSIHVTATAFTVTFTQGTLLKLTGSTNLATGANGCWLTFQVKPGGVCWETSRIVY